MKADAKAGEIVKAEFIGSINIYDEAKKTD